MAAESASSANPSAGRQPQPNGPSSDGMLPDAKRAPRVLGRVLVLGSGETGQHVIDYCLPLLGGRVQLLAVADGRATEAALQVAGRVRAAGGLAEVGEGAVEALREAADAHFDLCVASPGIAHESPLYRGAELACAEVISEVEFAWRESAKDSRWVAITGTNGKSTVTALTAHLLQEAGLRANAVGNIGDTCIAAVGAGATDVYVAEVSSYQLSSTRDFAPNVAVLLNITPDHLKYHGTFEAYCDAKFKLLDNLPGVSGAVAVFDATNDVVRARLRSLRQVSDDERGFACAAVGTAAGIGGDMRQACGAKNAAFLGEDGVLRVAFGGAESALVAAGDLQIHGEHNVGNALAASAAALAIGAPASAVAQGLRTFKPLEHRIEPCGSVRGAACFNDSKATNVDATLKAFASFPDARPIVLLGGDDKGTDLSDLVKAAHAHARAVVCFGAAGGRFAQAFEGFAGQAPADFRLLRAGKLADALDAALGVAGAGDVVLLSPACASFDEFSCFEERGRVFKALVAQRAASLGA